MAMYVIQIIICTYLQCFDENTHSPEFMYVWNKNCKMRSKCVFSVTFNMYLCLCECVRVYLILRFFLLCIQFFFL